MTNCVKKKRQHPDTNNNDCTVNCDINQNHVTQMFSFIFRVWDVEMCLWCVCTCVCAGSHMTTSVEAREEC